MNLKSQREKSGSLSETAGKLRGNQLNLSEPKISHLKFQISDLRFAVTNFVCGQTPDDAKLSSNCQLYRFASLALHSRQPEWVRRSLRVTFELLGEESPGSAGHGGG